jgi:hypothetical protein
MWLINNGTIAIGSDEIVNLLAGEHSQQLFGSATVDAVRLYQNMKSLSFSTPVLDWATVNALNSTISTVNGGEPVILTGNLRNEAGDLVRAAYQIRLFKASLNPIGDNDTPWKQTTSDATGAYSFIVGNIAEDAAQLRGYQLRAVNVTTGVSYRSLTTYLTGPIQRLDIVVSEAEAMPGYEYNMVLDETVAALNAVSGPALTAVDLDSAETRSYLEAATGESFDKIRSLVEATRLSLTLGNFNPGFLYGLARFNVSMTPAVLTVLPDQVLLNAAINAYGSHVIPTLSTEQTNGTISALRAALIVWLSQSGTATGAAAKPQDSATFRIFNKVLNDSEKTSLLLKKYFSYDPGSGVDFWSSLLPGSGTTPPFQPAEVADLKLAAVLAIVTGNNPALVYRLFRILKGSPLDGDPALSGASSANPLPQLLANFSVPQWFAIISHAKTQDPDNFVYPDYVTGTGDTARNENYALRLDQYTDEIYPTTAIGRDIAAAPQTPFTEMKQGFSTFIANNPDFDLRTTSYAKLASGSEFSTQGIENRETFIEEIGTVQRLMNLSPQLSDIAAMADKGYTSSMKIARTSLSEFTETLSASIPEAEATTIFNTAHSISNTVIANTIDTWGDISQSGRVPKSVDWIPISTDDPSSPQEDAYAEWRALFGSLDSCNCSECQSVYSPSAYFTDTMNFMETQIGDPGVFAELAERRRPDIRHIRLTCKNANTAVPQIDIINEMLEDLISNQHYKGQYAFHARETTAPAVQQRAIPEHVNTGDVNVDIWNGSDYSTHVSVKSPYPLLQSAVFPWSLPYNFYKRQIDNYLALPGISGYELLQRYSGNNKLEAWNDLAFCTAYLGISTEQMTHIATSRLVLGSNFADLLPYYGFKLSGSTIARIPDPAKRGSSIAVSLGTWILTLGSRVDVFLQQTGLSYTELLQLLDCYSLNPHVLAPGGAQRKLRISPIDPVNEASTCQLDRLTLLGLDADMLQLLYRFVQMSRTLGWSFYDLDRAFLALGITPPPFSPAHPAIFASSDVPKLVQLKRIVAASGLSVEQACLLYTDIDERPYRDYTRSEPADLPSTYERIFRNPLVFDVNSHDFPFVAGAGFSTPVDRNVLLNYLAGVLNISQQDLQEFPAGIIPNTATVSLSIQRLSQIYREALLIRLSRYSVRDWFRMKARFSDPALFGAGGLTAYDTPIDFSLPDTFQTIRLLEFCRVHQQTGLSGADLDFLLKDDMPDTAADDRQNKAMAATLATLHADLVKRWTGASYSAATDTEGARLLPLLQLVMDPEQAQLLVAVIQDTARFSIADPNLPDPDYSMQRIEDFVNKDLKFLLPAGSGYQLVFGAAAAATAPSHSYMTNPASRRDFVYQRVREYVIGESLKPAVVSAMSKHFKADEKLVAAVLGLISFPGRPGTGLDEIAGMVNQSAPVFDRWGIRSDRTFETMVLLSKALLLIGTFRLKADEITALWQTSQLPDSIRLADLPYRSQKGTTPAPAPYRLLSTFFRWMSVRDFLAEKSTDLFEAVGDTYSALSKSDFLDRLRLAFKMSRADIDTLLDSGSSTQGVLDAAYATDYRMPDLYLRIRDALEMQHLLPASMDALATIAGAIQGAQNQDDANEIIHVVKAQYSVEAWLEAVRPVSDKLRIERRDAMLAYLLANPPHPYENQWFTSNDIFETLLIDVEMSPCMPTTRILLGINSLQLWMDRVLMGLEKNTVSGAGLKIKKDPGRQWASWRKRYRIWEANRKIFIYPENWIEPELRDDKTPLFTELEKFLKQNEVTKENVELAYSTYLERLDELAHLDIIGIYRETKQQNYEVFMYNPGKIERDVVHVFGRTPAHPHIYYYRKRLGDEWTAWTKMDVQIDGEHFIPVFWRGRLRLYWLTFMKEQQPESATKVRTTTIPYVTPPSTNYKINLAWTELKNGNWTAKQVSKSSLYSMKIQEEDVMNHAHLDYFKSNDGSLSRAWYPVGTLDRQFRERFYVYNTLDDDGNLLFELHEKVVRNSSPSLNSRIYGGLDFSSIGTQNDEQFIPARLKAIESLDKYNDVFRSGTGTFLVTFNDVKASGNFRLPPSMFQPFFWDNSRNPKALENQGYRGWHTDLRYVPKENNPETNSGYTHFPNNVVLLNRAPDTDIRSKPKGKYLVFPREVAPDFTEGSLIRIPFFFYKDNDNSFFVEEVHISTGTTTGALNDWTMDDPKYVVTITDGIVATAQPVSQGGISIGTGGKNPGLSLVPGYQIFYRFHNFFHNRVYDFRQKLFESGIEGLLDRNYIKGLNDPAKDTILFAGTYQPTSSVMQKDESGRDVYPTNNVDFSYDAAFSTYNWEIFFHIPLLIANKLSQNQQFADARTWYQYIFNPAVANDLTTSTTILDFWNFEPFYQRATNVPTIYQIMQDKNLQNAVDRWANDPFKPHLVARTRITAYMKATVMKYLDNLIAWGDALFRTDSREDIVEATLLYVLAAQLLGRRPTQIPPRAIAAVQTYASLKATTTLNAFSNAMVKIESYLLTSGTTSGSRIIPISIGKSTPPAQMYLFCIPPNSKLTGYWDIIADRLFKIRNCQNIDGVTRDLALYDPPIDPALLVKAAAAGISATDALAAANAPLPVYRFQVLAQKATEIAGEVKALGSQLLSALEKKDAEKLSLLRSSQELRVLEAVTELKEKSIEEAAAQINGLDQQRNTVMQRRNYYQGLVAGGLNNEEQLQLESLRRSIPLHIAEGASRTLAGIFHGVPEALIGPFIAGLQYGGHNIGNVADASASVFGTLSNINSTIGSMAGIKAGQQRRGEEWEFQVKSADTELLQLDKQVIAAQIRMAIAEVDLRNHKLQAKNTLEMDEAMRSKYTNEELYDWMIGQISYTYMSAYKLALSMAMKAERCYQNELNAPGTSFISATYWDSLYKGLMAGEGLSYDIKRMEASYLDKNKRQLELSKHISLAALDPKALLDLKSKRSCTVRIPEWVYDMDYPGHHMRRIKSVSISIPCVAGPYTTVSCKLSLLKSKYRTSGISRGKAGYPEGPVGNDDRFKYVYGNIQSIATSHGQNDSGMFDFSFRDERYLPFEGAGAISEWEIKLPAAYAQFDRDSISDVILHINYTAQDEGGLAGDASEILKDRLETPEAPGFMSLFSLKHEFADAWYAYGSSFANSPTALKLHLNQHQYPMYSKGKQVSVQPLRLMGKWKKTGAPSGLTIELSYLTGSSATTISCTGTVADKYVTFDMALSAPIVTVNANTRLLKLVLKEGGVVKNMDEIFEDLYLATLNLLAGAVTAGAQSDPDWSDSAALPTLPSGARGWWMADAGVTRDQSSGNLTAWSDQTLNGNALQAASTLQQPLFFANGGPNDKAYLKFNGGHSLECPGFTLAAEPARNVFMVFRNTTVNNVAVLLETSTNFQYNPGSICMATNDGYNNHVATSHSGDAGLAVGGQNITLNQWSYVRFKNDYDAAAPTEATTYVNGGPGDSMSYWVSNEADNTGNFATSQPLFIGSRNNGAPFLKGDIAEVIIFERDLSSAEVTTVETYLKSKYAL